jgi:HEAT repeat protein
MSHSRKIIPTLASLLLAGCSNEYEALPPEMVVAKLADTDSNSHMKALRALSKPRNIPLLLTQLKSPNGTIRGSSVHALTIIGDKSSIPEIAKLEHDPDKWVRRWVAFSMRQFNAVPEAKTVQERMKLDPDSSVQAEARGDWF